MADEDRPAVEGRIGVALCDCATTLARRLDFEHLKKVASEEPGVVGVDQFGVLCGKDSSALAERLKAQGLDALVVAGCSDELLGPELKAALAQRELAPNMFSVANLKQECRGLSGAVATAKAAALVRQAIARARLLRPLEERLVEMSAAALVLGGGWSGLKVAEELIGAGYKVAVAEPAEEVGDPVSHGLATPEEQADLNGVLTAVRASEMPVLTNCELVSCHGVAGGFEVRLSQDGQAIEGRVGAIVVAPRAELIAPFEAYSLSPGDSVVSASQLEEMLASPKSRAKLEGRSVAFLVGLAGGEASPASMGRVLKAALAMAGSGSRAYVFTRDMRVAGRGLEALATEARQAGVVFFKFTDSRPEIEQRNGTLRLSFTDEIIGEPLELNPDLLAVAEQWRPAAWLPQALERLRVAQGPGGFAQPDNVHLFPVQSNREGIYVVGAARKPEAMRDSWAEAEVAASQVRALLDQGQLVAPVKATVNRGKCTICLTCVRFCPHGAIGWNNRALIMPEACQGCGICAAECPMEAIQLSDASDEQIEAQIAAWEAGTQLLQPRMVSFCCQRSAYQAMGLAVELGHTLPAGLQVVRVPCAGKVDVDYILKAFEAGADGVMVMGCHEDNCRSLRGNTYASWRVEAAQRMLAEVGLEPERVAFYNLASNMGSEFARLAAQMEARLLALAKRPPVVEVRPEAAREAATGT